MRQTNLSISRTFLVLGTFSIGTLITFGCALIYSGFQQPRASVRAASNVAFQRNGAGHLENQSSSGELAPDAEKNITNRAILPAQNSTSDPTTPGPALSGDERLQAEVLLPTGKAVSNAALESLSSNMGSVTNGNSVAAALSHTIRPPEVELTSQELQQQFIAAHTAGTAGALKPGSPDQPIVQPKSPEVSTFVPEEKTVGSGPERSVLTTTIDRGTSVEVRLADALSSDRNRTGDSFEALLAAPLVVNGTAVAGEGSTVIGRIADVRKARLIGGRGWVTLTLASIKLPDGRLVQIDTTRVRKSSAENPIIATTKIIPRAAFGTVRGALNGAAEGAGFNANRLSASAESSTVNGRVGVIPAGTEISFNLITPLTPPTKANR
jgi:hypothetical protein